MRVTVLSCIHNFEKKPLRWNLLAKPWALIVDLETDESEKRFSRPEMFDCKLLGTTGKRRPKNKLYQIIDFVNTQEQPFNVQRGFRTIQQVYCHEQYLVFDKVVCLCVYWLGIVHAPQALDTNVSCPVCAVQAPMCISCRLCQTMI